VSRLEDHRVFEVIGTQPSDRSGHRLQVAAMVIAKTSRDALAAFTEEFPAATVHNLNVKGPELVILDDEGD
jgi:hypothetical protein